MVAMRGPLWEGMLLRGDVGAVGVREDVMREDVVVGGVLFSSCGKRDGWRGGASANVFGRKKETVVFFAHFSSPVDTRTDTRTRKTAV